MILNQQYLDSIVNKPESSIFLDDVQAWSNHRILLYLGLELTKGSTKPILELGCGHGSTPHFNKYIQTDDRKVISFDTNEEWVNKFSQFKSDKHEFVYKPDNFAYDQKTEQWYDKTPEIINWLDNVSEDGISVCLVDHACGERRHSDLKRIHTKCDVIVIHDSEPPSTGYMMDRIWHLFKYVLHYKKNNLWASIVSNKYDVTKFDKMKIREFEVNV
jgi:hypothetical protein